MNNFTKYDTTISLCTKPMKLREVFELQDEQLNESLIRKALAAAGFVLAAAGPSALLHTPELDLKPVTMLKKQTGPNMAKLVSVAASKYRVSTDIVQQAVASAIKHQHPDFPTAKDILAVVGVESSFKPDAVSQLKTDPARGLMQVRPGVWKLPEESFKSIDSQIETGSKILRKYYLQLGDREAALHAYNVGIGNHKKGKGTNPRYVPKIDKEKSLYRDI